MKTNNVFIVNDEQGPRVITQGTLEKDIQSRLTAKVKTKDVESYAQDLIGHLNGKAINRAEYDTALAEAETALTGFSTLTPWAFGELLNEIH